MSRSYIVSKQALALTTWHGHWTIVHCNLNCEAKCNVRLSVWTPCINMWVRSLTRVLSSIISACIKRFLYWACRNENPSPFKYLRIVYKVEICLCMCSNKWENQMQFYCECCMLYMVYLQRVKGGGKNIVVLYYSIEIASRGASKRYSNIWKKKTNEKQFWFQHLTFKKSIWNVSLVRFVTINYYPCCLTLLVIWIIFVENLKRNFQDMHFILIGRDKINFGLSCQKFLSLKNMWWTPRTK